MISNGLGAWGLQTVITKNLTIELLNPVSFCIRQLCKLALTWKRRKCRFAWFQKFSIPLIWLPPKSAHSQDVAWEGVDDHHTAALEADIIRDMSGFAFSLIVCYSTYYAGS